MKRFQQKPPLWGRPLLVCAILLAIAAPVLAIDQVRTLTGNVSGDVKKISSEGVSMQVKGAAKVISPLSVTAIFFGSEPAAVRRAREDYIAGRYEDVLNAKNLEGKEGKDGKANNPGIVADLAFLPAASAAKIALRGASDPKQPLQSLTRFVKEHANSYHVYEAELMLGKLLLASGDTDGAEAHFQRLAQGKSASVKALGLVHLGEVYLSRNDLSKAAAGMSDAAKSAGAAKGEDAALEAKLGLAVRAALGEAAVRAKQGKVDEAIASIEKIIAELPADEAELHARAYNTLGACCEAAERWNDAALAYLHLELLFSEQAEAHAHALRRLKLIWTKSSRPDRAAETSEVLKKKYPFFADSPG